MSALSEALSELPALATSHLLLSSTAVGIASAVGLPLALWATRSGKARGPMLAAVGLIQTVPALALLALFYPLLLALGRLSGVAIPALGFLPALLALTLYALLPIVRNSVVAIETIDPATIEAADGLGMTRRQRTRLVELPLAAPVILAGIRTAAVWTIGAATLATTVGQSSLGNLIFSGLQTENWVRVAVGCVASAALALAVDGLLALVETGLARRSAMRIRTGLAVLAATIIAAASPLLLPQGERVPVIVGAKNFSEQYILASMMARKLDEAGFSVSRREDMGSAVAYRAVAAGDIDVYVDYTGTLWTNVLNRQGNLPPAEMRKILSHELRKRDGVILLGALGFENAYALAMRRPAAAKAGIVSIADLAIHAPVLKLGSDLEFLSRPEWRSVESRYKLEFSSEKSYSPTFMYRAIADGSADVLSVFSSDGRIAELDLVTLADPLHALPSYDAVILVSPKRAGDERFLAALRPLVGAIAIERMREANLMVDRDLDKQTPDQSADWLLSRLRR